MQLAKGVGRFYFNNLNYRTNHKLETPVKAT